MSTNRNCEQSSARTASSRRTTQTGVSVEILHHSPPGEPGGDTWGDMPVEQRAAGPWGHVGSYDPVRKVLYWGIANPNPYTRLTRHGGPEGVSRSAPANLYSNSTVAIDINTGKLNWYYQELPGDDWDADHNHERVLIRTRVSPDARHVKWINPDIRAGQERDIVLTTAEGGGMWALDQQTGQFLWARRSRMRSPIQMNFST